MIVFKYFPINSFINHFMNFEIGIQFYMKPKNKVLNERYVTFRYEIDVANGS